MDGTRRVGMAIVGLSGLAAALLVLAASRATPQEDSVADAKVRAFLEKSRGSWHDWNVPEEDGHILHDLVVKHRFRSALEIGTSTGHSSVWIAWALSKTGGKLDDDRDRPRRATRPRCGTSRRRASPRSSTRGSPTLTSSCSSCPGPFDFVFSDADKDWYLQYFKDLEPKIAPGGCFTAHNVLRSGGGGAAGFLEYVKKLPGYETTVETGGGEGISISCKRR